MGVFDQQQVVDQGQVQARRLTLPQLDGRKPTELLKETFRMFVKALLVHCWRQASTRSTGQRQRHTTVCQTTSLRRKTVSRHGRNSMANRSPANPFRMVNAFIFIRNLRKQRNNQSNRQKPFLVSSLGGSSRPATAGLSSTQRCNVGEGPVAEVSFAGRVHVLFPEM